MFHNVMVSGYSVFVVKGCIEGELEVEFVYGAGRSKFKKQYVERFCVEFPQVPNLYGIAEDDRLNLQLKLCREILCGISLSDLYGIALDDGLNLQINFFSGKNLLRLCLLFGKRNR